MDYLFFKCYVSCIYFHIYDQSTVNKDTSNSGSKEEQSNSASQPFIICIIKSRL